MSLQIRKATKQEFKQIISLYEDGIDVIVPKGISQWQWGVYPSEDILQRDMHKGQLYGAWLADALVAAFVLDDECDPQYSQVAWRYGQNPAVLHRVMINPAFHGQGVGEELIVWILDHAAGLDYDCLRLDSYILNEDAIELYENIGMRRAGTTYFDESAIPYVCFEIPVKEECCLLPILMQPAFRHGKDTPWGGSGLSKLFGKKTPDDHTGESLEVSAIPGLESRDPQGFTVTELSEQHGKALLGDWAGKTFPLLLKLLDAKDALSVQVHPDDSFANKEENGKLGKSEAWVILAAEPGAQLVYGIEPGTSLAALSHAARQGRAVEHLLHRVKVEKGDVLYIPAGCVHAIGAGIVLYEIQQSSDVTYRFYDWERRDSQGHGRELHIDKALHVTDLKFDPTPAHTMGTVGLHRLLDTPFFTLDQAKVNGRLELPALPNAFRFLTALDNLLLQWEGDMIPLKPGSTLLIPATCPTLTLAGVGQALIAAPCGA